MLVPYICQKCFCIINTVAYLLWWSQIWIVSWTYSTGKSGEIFIYGTTQPFLQTAQDPFTSYPIQSPNNFVTWLLSVTSTVYSDVTLIEFDRNYFQINMCKIGPHGTQELSSELQGWVWIWTQIFLVRSINELPVSHIFTLILLSQNWFGSTQQNLFSLLLWQVTGHLSSEKMASQTERF